MKWNQRGIKKHKKQRNQQLFVDKTEEEREKKEKYFYFYICDN